MTDLFSKTRPTNEPITRQELSSLSDSGSDLDSDLGLHTRSAVDGHPEQVEKHKFVGRSSERRAILDAPYRSNIEPPIEVRRSLDLLGLDRTNFTADDVHRAWRKHMSSPQVHPDLGGEAENAILLNAAKDSLVKWLDSFAPKLGKHFSHLANK